MTFQQAVTWDPTQVQWLTCAPDLSMPPQNKIEKLSIPFKDVWDTVPLSSTIYLP